jgi:two-component system, OmpR family, sensor histidine kinase QseC
MTSSIRRFLLVSLLISITIASSITAIGNYLLDKGVIQPYLDEKLVRFFNIIEAINESVSVNARIEAAVEAQLGEIEATKNHHLIFQVWDRHGKLIFHSGHKAFAPLYHVPAGFSDTQMQNNDWRVYANDDIKTHDKIIVAELYDVRDKLADEIARNNAYILLVTYPIFGVLIWLIVGLALRSITRVTSEISNRASTYLEPVEATYIPIEIMPMVSELNELFMRLKLAFDRNKRFAGDAAHELRTPLAALKTQAQVALKADNAGERKSALLKVIQGVDRSSHVVAQLLTLSRLGQEEALNDIAPMDLHRLTTEIMTYLVPIALEKNIEVELLSPPTEMMILGNDTALGILIRNIVDNAIRYTPPQGEVKVQLLETHNHIILRVIDSGPGIPLELRERVFERFFRILGTTAPGSGLGLAIVSQIADLHHAHVNLNTPPNGKGLQFDVVFPKLKNFVD